MSPLSIRNDFKATMNGSLSKSDRLEQSSQPARAPGGGGHSLKLVALWLSLSQDERDCVVVLIDHYDHA